MTIKELRERWDKSDLAKKSKQNIVRALKKGREISSDLIPFNRMPKGHLDLRGLTLNSIKMKNVNFNNIDFSHCTFNSAWIQNCLFENVVLEKVDFSNVTEMDNSFNKVNFINAKISKSYLGHKGSTFESSHFLKTNFSGTSFIRPEFDSCKFENCKLNGIDFNGSSFNNCVFIGELSNVWFRGTFPSDFYIKEFGVPRGNTMSNVSFEKASLNKVHFSNNCDLSSVVLPEKGDYILFDSWNERLKKLKTISQNWSFEGHEEVRYFVNPQLVHSKNQDWYILSINDIHEEFGNELSKEIVDTLADL